MNSGFFNAQLVDGVYDRRYNASIFAKYFKQFIGNGVYANPGNGLQVVGNNGMSVQISLGACFIEGYFGYIDTTPDILQIEQAEANNRIDRIVCRLNIDTRSIDVIVLKGISAVSPVAPSITRTDSIYDLVLADILVQAGATSISQSVITDQRTNSELCGFCVGVLQQLDLTSVTQQYQTMWENWFESIKDSLSEDAATDLYNKYENLENTLDGFVQEKINTSIRSSLAEQYPIGYTFMVNNTNDYSSYLGFTWARSLQGVSPVGYNPNDSDYNSISKTGGRKTVTLTAENMPPHTHAVSDPGHAHNVTYMSGSGGSTTNPAPCKTVFGSDGYSTWGTAASGTGIWINSAGGRNGAAIAFDIRGPWKVMAFWTRTA